MQRFYDATDESVFRGSMMPMRLMRVYAEVL